MDKSKIYEALGQAIRKRREILGLKQDEVAKGVQLSRASITNIELGRQSVLVDQIYAFAKVLKTDPIKLLPGGLSTKEKLNTSMREPLSPRAEQWIERIRKSA